MHAFHFKSYEAEIGDKLAAVGQIKSTHVFCWVWMHFKMFYNLVTNSKQIRIFHIKTQILSFSWKMGRSGNTVCPVGWSTCGLKVERNTSVYCGPWTPPCPVSPTLRGHVTAIYDHTLFIITPGLLHWCSLKTDHRWNKSSSFHQQDRSLMTFTLACPLLSNKDTESNSYL